MTVSQRCRAASPCTPRAAACSRASAKLCSARRRSPRSCPSIAVSAGADGKDYLVSYTDCCGRSSCGLCDCHGNVRERPGYSMGVHNDVNWCMANKQVAYHCTVSVIVGMADG
jgi:hypothetical protein